MSNNTLNSEVKLVLTKEQESVLNEVGLGLINASNINDQLIDKVAVLLGDEPSLELWNGVFSYLESFIASQRGIKLDTAKNINTFIRKELKDRYELTKPQSAQAIAKQAKREVEKNNLAKKYGSQSVNDLKKQLIATSDKKEFDELTKAISIRNKQVDAEQKTNAKEVIKDALKKINDFIKADNSLDDQVARATAIVNFINKQS